jgi:hypothetical protein
MGVIHNVYFRHPDIPGYFWNKATDFTYAKSVLHINGVRELQRMHEALGLIPHNVTKYVHQAM